MSSVRICLDAGHVGSHYNQSPVVKTYYESAMVWSLHLKLKAALEARGFEVMTTRVTIDTDIQAVKSSSSSTSSSSAKKGGGSTSTPGSLKTDYTSYLDSGRGSSPTASGNSGGGYANVTKSKKALANKKDRSPAVDDADTSKVRSKLKTKQRST